MNVAAYCRVSTDKNDQLNSLDTQREFFEDYTNKAGYTLVNIYADEGISGTRVRNRFEFQRLMIDAKRRKFDMVLVKDISRFARNTVDFLNAIRLLKMLNIETVFLTANQKVLGGSEFVLTIFGALAQEESANTSKRVKFGKKLNAQKGRVPNLVYGYDKVPGDYFNLNINKDEAEVIRKIFDLYVHKMYGSYKIANLLNCDGIKTKRGSEWTQTSVVRVLTNEIYTGIVVNGKEEIGDFLTGDRIKKNREEWFVTENKSLKIIDADDFKLANKILEDRGSNNSGTRTGHSCKNIFSTIIKCGVCGSSFRRLAGRKSAVYWVCNGRNSKGADTCSNKSKIIEIDLLSVILNYTISNTKGVTADDIMKTIGHKFCELDILQSLEENILKLDKKKGKYIYMYEQDLLDEKQFSDKICEINNNINLYKRKLKLSHHILKDNNIRGIIDSKLNDNEYILNNVKNAHLKQFIDKIVVGELGDTNIYFKKLAGN